jgi:hypothetical protein
MIGPKAKVRKKEDAMKSPELFIIAPTIINLLCISRQFQTEYEQRVYKQTILIMSQRWGTLAKIAANKNMQKVMHANCFLEMGDFPFWEIEMGNGMFKRAVGRLNLTSMHVFLMLPWTKTKMPDRSLETGTTIRGLAQNFTEIGCVKSLPKTKSTCGGLRGMVGRMVRWLQTQIKNDNGDFG